MNVLNYADDNVLLLRFKESLSNLYRASKRKNY